MRINLRDVEGRVGAMGWPIALGSSLLLFSVFGVSSESPAQTGGAQDWNQVLTAANQEGRIVLYTHTVPSVNDRLKADFEKVFPGIKLEHSRPGGGTPAKVEFEGKTGADGADVIIVVDALWLQGADRQGWMLPPGGPNTAAWPSRYKWSPNVFVFEVEPLVIAYNTNLVKVPPKGYADIFRPDIGGKFSTGEPVTPQIAGWYDWLEKTQGADFLPRLAARKPNTYPSTVPAAQALASGELSVSVLMNPTAIQPLIDQGAPVRIVVPNPAIGFGFGGGILSWAKRPNAARVFLDYLSSRRGQSAMHAQNQMASPLPRIPGALDIETVTAIDSSKYPPDVVEQIRAKWNQLFRR